MGKKIGILLMICFLAMGKVDVNAVTYSYSIGTKWSDSQDYTGNVGFSATEYMSIDNLIAHSSFKPTGTYIRSNNPNGNRIIASKLVFLNGHANFQRIYFNHMYNTSYMTGICTGNDKESGGYVFAGLASTDMSTCKVITFAGCDTGYLGSDYKCLAEKAVERGAKTAVGWRGTIYSLYTEGEKWLQIYNHKLASGYSVSKSISAAADAYPTDELTTLVQIAGSPTQTVAAASIEDDSTYLQLENVVDMEAVDFDNEYILESLEKYNSDIELSDYKVSVNMFDPVNGDGYVIFTYYIDGEIRTNKSYVCHIEGNQLSYITDTLAEDSNEASSFNADNTENTLSEKDVIAKVNNHKESKVLKASTSNLVNLKEYKEVYHYDYKTNKLTYREYIAENDSELDVVIPEVNETEL